jgi:hypothetical protein
VGGDGDGDSATGAVDARLLVQQVSCSYILGVY